MKKVVTVLMISFILIANAQQDKKAQDLKAIKSMSGCFEVGFNFAETFNYSKDSLYKPSKKKHDKALEWVEVITDKKSKIQMQHLLIVGPKERPHIVKHWRQDWLYENQDLYLFHKDSHWKYKKLDKESVQGQWTQKVYQVDDSPRYEGTATWVHVDGKSFWENTADAPLARRELTKRSDYNVMLRRNRHEITENGWIHNQDNDKIVREDGKEDFLLAQEKGFNTYKRVPDNKCIAAQNWWKNNHGLWKKVRKRWDRAFDNDKDIALQAKVNNKKLYSHLFKLKADASKKQVNEIIDSFIK
ncbi:DUF6607 family protein [uncultured Tenacibaculum sp.]|uniref:DUF6607 family protein n=1 Tax=uncultured Tenacibaculum sp. TaxID=174713 RepID=UPI00262C8A27|nr:DUF6607 family protein [uncultured Tenacibaculum sp.]